MQSGKRHKKRQRQPKAARPPRGARRSRKGPFPCGNAGARPRRARSHRGVYPVDFKLKTVKLKLEEGYSISFISKELGVSYESVSRWVKQYQAEGAAGLQPKFAGAGRRQVSREAQSKAVSLKRDHPDYGSRRISQILRRVFFLKAGPETVRRTLKEQDLVKPRKKKPQRMHIPAASTP